MPTPPAPKSPAMAAVERAGRKLARANATRDKAVAELRDALRAADREGGHSRSELVAAAGVARQTVYDALRDQPAPTPISAEEAAELAPLESTPTSS